MTNWYVYPYKGLTGGVDGALDSLDGSVLKEGDAAIVINPTTRKMDVLTVDDDSAADEDSPRVIKPDTNAGDKRFCKVKLHDGIHEYLSYYTNFETAVAEIGATVCTLVVDTSNSIADDCSVPATLTLEFRRGCVLTVASGKTLAVGGKIVTGDYQIFDGDGSVTFAVNQVVDVYPEWWGTFPNGTDDTDCLNKALAAAYLVGHSSGFDIGRVVVKSGIYYIRPGDLDPIIVNFHAPHAHFIVTEEPEFQTTRVMQLGSSIVTHLLDIDIGMVSGVIDDIMLDQAHYGLIYIPKLYQSNINIKSIRGLYKGIWYGEAEEHRAENIFRIGAILGCDYGWNMESGSDADTQCEANKIYINYIASCLNAVDVASHAHFCISNLIEVQVMELQGRASATGIRISGQDCINNTFRVTGHILPPSGAGPIVGVYNDATYGTPNDNVFELCYYDATKIHSVGGNILRNIGDSRQGGPGSTTSMNLARSVLMLNAAPSTQYWREGDRVINNTPSSGTFGWVNVVSGNNGTWRKFAPIYLEANNAWTPGNIGAGQTAYSDVSVPGAVVGDFTTISFNNDTGFSQYIGKVLAGGNTVSCQITNPTGNNVNHGSLTVYVRVYKR